MVFMILTEKTGSMQFISSPKECVMAVSWGHHALRGIKNQIKGKAIAFPFLFFILRRILHFRIQPVASFNQEQFFFIVILSYSLGV